MREILIGASSEAEPSRGPYMRMYSGLRFWPFSPRTEDMCIEDVAHHLAMQVRFNGAVKDHYSVAEHCVIGSYLVRPEDAFEFLMHDAAEAWLGDLIRPLKHDTVLGDEYKKIEESVERQVRQKWGLNEITPSNVKRVDDIMCELEKKQVYRWCEVYYRTPPVRLQFWSWREAEWKFLARFYELAPRLHELDPEEIPL